jgi:hypothetical protein
MSSIIRFASLLQELKLTLRYLDQIVGPLVISGALFWRYSRTSLFEVSNLVPFSGKSHLVPQFGLYEPFRNRV